jgi:hypothetical protein
MNAKEINVGLDQYAYAAAKSGVEWDGNNHRELSYWRKHPNLQGWMEQLWRNKGCPGGDVENSDNWNFNGIEVELTWEDLDALEEDIRNSRLPATSGFFFGTPSDEYYLKDDLEFIKKARAEIFTGLKVFYNSSW